jgi:hypothetical protein
MGNFGAAPVIEKKLILPFHGADDRPGGGWPALVRAAALRRS